MKHIAMRLLPLMLLVVCCSASAEWIFVSEVSSGQRFIESTSIEITGSKRRYWILHNSKEDSTSAVYLYELDCKKRVSKILQGDLFEKHWAGGKTLLPMLAEKEFSPEYIRPGTSGDTILKHVCSK